MKTKKTNKQATVGVIPTFSINTNSYSDRVCRILSQLNGGKTYTPEFLSDMYFKAVDGEDIKDISAYSREMEKLALLKRSNAATVAILSEDEVKTGFQGISEKDIVSTFDDIEDSLCKNHLVEQFLDIRENLYYTLGVDIYRLLELILQGDTKAKSKLNLVVFEYPELKDFIYEVLTTPGTFADIQAILA